MEKFRHANKNMSIIKYLRRTFKNWITTTNIMIFYSFVILISLIGVQCENDAKFERIVDYVSSPYREIKNLTCISHETTFTCDCGNSDENMNLPPLSGHVYQISVRNCKSLEVSSNLLINTQALRSVQFTNVDNLVLRENSLSFPLPASNMPLNLKFNQVQIEKIDSHAINGNIQEISFNYGSIGTISAFGITTRSEGNILRFNSMFIDRIEALAFKKFTVNKLEIKNSVITSTVPSKSFYDISITDEFILNNVTFKEVHSNAFLFEDISKLIIINNNFEMINGEWFTAGVKTSILIQNNEFGITSPIAFKGIKLHKDYKKSERLELRFINNTVRQSSDPLPLDFDKNFNVVIPKLTYVNNYPCYYKDKKYAFFLTYPDTIYFRSSENPSKYLTITNLLNNECQIISNAEYIIGGCIGLVILLILIGLLICYCVIRKRRKSNAKLDIVVPEPRTYKETQIVLQIENAGLLKTDL